MIAISVNNKFLKLPKNLEIRINYKMPWSETDAIAGAFTYQFEIENEGNEEIFGFSHHIFINAGKSYKIYQNVRLYIFDIQFQNVAEILVLSQKAKTSTISIIWNRVNSILKEKPLSELKWPADISMSANDNGTDLATADIIDYCATVVTKTWPEVNFNFPIIRNPKFYDLDKNFTGTSLNINNWSTSSQNFETNFEDGNKVLQNNNSLVPQPYLYFLLTEIWKNLGYTLTGSAYNNEEFKKLLVYGNRALDFNLYFDKYLATGSPYVGNFEDPGIYYHVQFTSPTVPFPDFENLRWISVTDVDNSLETSGYDTYYRIKGHGKHRILANLNITVNREDLTTESPIFGDYYSCELAVYFIPPNSSTPAKLYSVETVLNWPATETTVDGIYEKTFNRAIEYTHEFSKDDMGGLIFISCSIWLYHEFAYNPAGGYMIQYYYGRYYFPSGTLEIENLNRFALNKFNKNFVYKNHVPPFKVGEFLNAAKNLLGVYFEPLPSGEVKMNALNDVLNFPIVDWTHLYNDNSHEIKPTEPGGFEIEFTPDSTDEVLKELTESFDNTKLQGEYNELSDFPAFNSKEDLAYLRLLNQIFKSDGEYQPDPAWRLYSQFERKYSEGDPTLKLKTAFAPMSMVQTTHPSLGFLYPQISAQGSSEAFNQKNDASLRIMIWHGLQENAGGALYPFASSASLNNQAEDVGNLDLKWSGEKGLLKHSGRFYKFKAAAVPIKVGLNFNAQNFQNFRTNIRPRIINQNYVLEEINFLISINGKIKTEATLLREQ